MKVAWFTPLRSSCAQVRDDLEHLLPAIARETEIDLLVEGESALAPTLEGLPVHDLRSLHYRKLLWRYDLVVYALAGAPEHEYMHRALCEWPGVVLAYGDLEPLFLRLPELRRAVLDRSLLVGARDAAEASRLRRELPFTEIARLAVAGSIDDRVRVYRALFGRAIDGRRRWLEAVLETACAEVPGWLPGDRRAAWHAELEELLSLSSLPRSSG